MELWQKIVEAYPEIDATSDFTKIGILLQDDSDGAGAYIAKWEYSQPLPNGFKVGKE
jgi:hypothetical protein